MTGYVYFLKTFNSAMDMAHGYYQQITEVHVPDLACAFNKDYIFQCTSDRYKEAILHKIINLTDDSISIIKNSLEAKNEFLKFTNGFKILDAQNVLDKEN